MTPSRCSRPSARGAEAKSPRRAKAGEGGPSSGGKGSGSSASGPSAFGPKAREEGRIAVSKKAVLVDDAWSAPGATGCGGLLVELIIDPIINSAAGVPAAAGKNTAILKNELNIASAAAVRKNNAENP
jgi:hypothetical protein